MFQTTICLLAIQDLVLTCLWRECNLLISSGLHSWVHRGYNLCNFSLLSNVCLHDLQQIYQGVNISLWDTMGFFCTALFEIDGLLGWIDLVVFNWPDVHQTVHRYSEEFVFCIWQPFNSWNWQWNDILTSRALSVYSLFRSVILIDGLLSCTWIRVLNVHYLA